MNVAKIVIELSNDEQFQFRVSAVDAGGPGRMLVEQIEIRATGVTQWVRLHGWTRRAGSGAYKDERLRALTELPEATRDALKPFLELMEGN